MTEPGDDLGDSCFHSDDLLELKPRRRRVQPRRVGVSRRTIHEPITSPRHTRCKEPDMTEVDWNKKVIEEFRANEGRVGGNFEGAPMVLVHHRGRKSGREYVTPMMYLPNDADDNVIYVFASKAGQPSNPDWYYNLTAAGEGSVERGVDSYPVTVRALNGDERDRIYDEQARRYPGFAEYAEKTEGIRIIPVLELTRSLSDSGDRAS
jgi:deazaflavin-dependent oxidoreductase (nitroreductase family)